MLELTRLETAAEGKSREEREKQAAVKRAEREERNRKRKSLLDEEEDAHFMVGPSAAWDAQSAGEAADVEHVVHDGRPAAPPS